MSTDSTEEVVESTEDDAAALAAFNRGLHRNMPQPSEAAAESVAPSDAAAESATVNDGADELAGLSPAVRAKLDEYDSLRAAAAQIPTLEHKWRSEQGRVAALQAELRQAHAAPPPEPKRMEAFERVKAELPEVADAMEEYFQSRQPQKVEAQPDAEAPLSILGEEAPDWEQTVTGMPFQQWIATQDPAYREKVNKTNSEAVMLAAITKFQAHQQITAERSAAAQKAAQTRQARVSAAVVPLGAGRREPSSAKTPEDWFQEGLRRKHRQ